MIPGAVPARFDDGLGTLVVDDLLKALLQEKSAVSDRLGGMDGGSLPGQSVTGLLLWS